MRDGVSQAKQTLLKEEDVQWVVNDLAELGVKIGDDFFFLYKGRSYQGGSRWRPVSKREFGECCHPWQAIKNKCGEERLPKTYEGFHNETLEEWLDLPWTEGVGRDEQYNQQDGV